MAISSHGAALRCGLPAMRTDKALLLTLVAALALAGARAGPAPCTWRDGKCAVNGVLMLQANPRDLSEPERTYQQVLFKTLSCRTASSQTSCLGVEDDSCIWAMENGMESCALDRSFIELGMTCPGSTQRTIAECGLKRTSQGCNRDTRCTWKDDYYDAVVKLGKSASKRDLCYLKASRNLDYKGYLDYLNGPTNPTPADVIKRFGRCDAMKAVVAASGYMSKCEATFKPPVGCTTNCASALEKQKRACLAAGCAWDRARAVNWKTGPPPCSAAESKYWDLYFGPTARGIIRNQMVQCPGPVASKSQRACESYKLQSTSGRRALETMEEQVEGGASSDSQWEEQQEGPQMLGELPWGTLLEHVIERAVKGLGAAQGTEEDSQ